MKFLIEDSKDGQKAYETIVVKDPSLFSVLRNTLTIKIIRELAKEPSCALDVARSLKQHEQKIYYHMRKLEELGLIKLLRREERVGATAKIYKPASPVISFKLFDGETLTDVNSRPTELKMLKPFIETGKLNSILIIGSPDPHGKYKSTASDGYCAITLGVFLGQYLRDLPEPFYKLDTQIKEEDLKKNIIVLGGPKANIISDRINDKLPIHFEYSKESLDWNIISNLSKNVYKDKHVGIIVRIKSIFSENKEILLLAGKGFTGSRAAVLALTKYPKEVMKGNSIDPSVMAKVVQGVDLDADGIVDDVEFLE